MNANNVINDQMTLEEKLKAIENMVASVDKENVKRKKQGLAPIDPADATICEGCS